MHRLLDYDDNLPAYINVTDAKTLDNKRSKDIPYLLKGLVKMR
jgi:hypothetical protein